jgi:iron complex transport system substrate-binding protein
MNFYNYLNPVKVYGLIGVAVVLLLTSCSRSRKPEDRPIFSPTSIQYAEGFTITEKGSALEVTVTSPEGFRQEYILRGKNNVTSVGQTEANMIEVPLQRVVCLASTHVALINSLQETDKIIGLESRRSVYNADVVKAVEAGNIYEVGNYDALNLELLVNIGPDAIFQSVRGMPASSAAQMENLSLRTVEIPAHYETHPLGRLEWIKFFALFFDKQAYADSLFQRVEQSYKETMQLVQKPAHRPTVVAGYFSKGVWIAPGGKSYFAKLLHDAGADYIWKDDSTSGNLKLSYEELVSKGIHADYFINIQMVYKDREQVLADLSEAKSFKSVQANKFYMNNATTNANGKNNYWERGFTEPHVILRDLVKILHPELLPDYMPVYFTDQKQQ